MGRHLKPPSVGLIRLRSPHPGLMTITAPASLFRAVGYPTRHADHLTQSVTKHEFLRRAADAEGRLD